MRVILTVATAAVVLLTAPLAAQRLVDMKNPLEWNGHL
jgi:hypothetical protein